MDGLGGQIARELEVSKHFAVYEDELSLIWPISDKEREEKIRRFASGRGFRVAFYKQGLCAIFTKELPPGNV